MGASLLFDFAMGAEPVLLAAAAGITCDRWQKRLLRCQAPRVLVNITRQGGKSETAALLALHTALYQPGSLTLIVSRAERQSGELFKKVLRSYRALGRPVPATAETVLQLQLESGSRIIALPGSENTIRSFSGVALPILAGASRMPDETHLA